MSGLFDVYNRIEEIKERQTPLQRLNNIIDWEMFRPLLDEALMIEAKGLGGRPPFDRILMLKILILQRYYNLSDEQTEFQIKDRFSFMDFLKLSLSDKIPDQKTLWYFKERLKEKDTALKLFNLFTDTLAQKGIVAKEGSIVDASFVDVPKQRNTRDQNKIIKDGSIPKEFHNNPHKLRQKDTDARWTKKNNETHYGYKNHIKACDKTKLITGFTTTTANVHDSVELKNLVNETDTRLHADSAYRSKDIEAYLVTVGCESRIHEKGYKNNPLTEEQKSSNTIKSKIRARVEHVFGLMTNSMNNGLFMRSIGQHRIYSTVGVLNLTYNLMRYEQLVRFGKVCMVCR